jgi:drug/metabolite transporter (DMT)-like permease
MKTPWVLYAKVLFAVLAWGASFIATKVALREVLPVTIVWLRFAMGVAILWGVVLARRQFRPVPAREVGYLALLGFLGITFHQWLQSNALVTTQANTTAWIVATTPVFMALLGWLVLGETLGPVHLAGIGLATLGVLLVVTGGDLAALARGRFGTVGDALVLISAPNWAVFSILSRRGLGRYPPALMMAYVMALGWLFTSALVALDPGPAGLPQVGNLSAAGWLAVLFLGVACSGLAYVFWYDALERISAARVGAFLYLEPLAAVVVAALVLGEPVVAAALVGGGAILAGVWLVNRARAAHPARPSPATPSRPAQQPAPRD